MSNSWLLQYLTDTIPETIAGVIILFNLIGNFGNFNVIFATWRDKSLHTKHGWLLVILRTEHSICLLFEFINVYFALTGTQVYRRTCLILMSPYLFITFLQSVTFLALAIDVRLSLTWPVLYQTLEIRNYCAFFAISPSIFSILLMFLVWSRVSDEIVFLCNPPLSMDPQSVDFYGGFITGVNLLISIVYGYVFRIARRMHQASGHASHTHKIMRSLTILVLVFCFSWVTCMSLVFLCPYITSNPLVITLIRSYAVIFAVLSYSQTFFVYYFRSELYRNEFKRQLCGVERKTSRVSSILVSTKL